MLLVRRKPDDIPGTDFLDRTALALRAATTGSDDQGLAKRMGMPRGASAGLERDAGATSTCRFGASNRGSIRTVPVKYSAGPLPDGCEPFLLISIFSFFLAVEEAPQTLVLSPPGDAICLRVAKRSMT